MKNMRSNLIKARKDKKWSQEQTAEKLGISLRQYQRIESGESIGTIDQWDRLEDLFLLTSRYLRGIPAIGHGKEDSPSSSPEDQQS